MKKLVLLRHGESTWNMENRFTGWTDVDLSERLRAPEELDIDIGGTAPAARMISSAVFLISLMRPAP